MAEERLQKWLANAGHGSRRQLEGLIKEGRIKVNGEVAELGCKVAGDERISIDGRFIRTVNAKRVERTIMYFKPPGEICTRSDPENRATIFDSLPKVSEARWVSVGRLDVATAGLLLLTTDGGLANKLMHPSSEIAREYVVRVLGEPTEDELKQLSTGVQLDDGMARFEGLHFTRGEGSNRWYRVMLREGRNRIVRRLWNHFGYDVSRLMRISYGPIQLPRGLGRGKFRDLTAKELNALKKVAYKK
ncbi:MAG: pseudouridine synthase [Gammaproteobacteria bacterium]|nr:pseudouridine synthase [Gammaproteobacteria bacterium]